MNYTYLESATTTTKKNKKTKKQRNKQTNKQTNKQKRTETEPIYRTKILRLPHTYSHYKHTHTRMHRRRNQKGLIIN